MQPTLATVEDLDQWFAGVAMAEKSIRAGSSETPQPRHEKQIEEKRHSHHSVNTFNISSVTQQERDTLRCPGCNGTHQHHMKHYRRFKIIPVEKRAEIVKDRCLINQTNLINSSTKL